MKPTDFAHQLTAFLTDYLPDQRNVSPNTVKSYRDTFVLFLRYCNEKRNWPANRLNLRRITDTVVLDFLEYLEKEKGSCIRTCNQRLAALRSFFGYLQTKYPDHILQYQKILSISFRRFKRRPVKYLTSEELCQLFSEIDVSTPNGQRDTVLLSVLYDTAARVQELVDLKVEDVRLDTPAHLCLNGKGQKRRIVPLMKSTTELLATYMKEKNLLSKHQGKNYLFTNRLGRQMSRSGVRYILLKYVEQVQRKKYFCESVSPHVLRHSKAMHLLEAKTPLVIIRDFLGHVDFKTTEIYAKVNLEMKREALEKAASPLQKESIGTQSWQKDKNLLDWLKSL